VTAPRAAILGALLLLSAARPAAQQPARDTPPVTGAGSLSISGRVLATDGRTPLRRAIVRLSSANIPKPRATRTDADGLYTFGNLPASGSFTISAAKPQYLRLEYGQRRPFEPGRPLSLAAKSLIGVDFRLPRAAAISGTVIDGSGEPVDRMRVFAFRRVFADGRLTLRSARATVTNDAGQYRLSGLPPGDYYVAALEMATPTAVTFEPTGYATTYYPGTTDEQQAQPVRLALGQEVANLDVPVLSVRTATVSGQVVSADGKPLSFQANVGLQDSTGSGVAGNMVGGAFMERKTFEAPATFTIRGVRPGSYQLVVSGSGGERGVLPIEVGETDLTGLTLVVGSGGSLAGRITTTAGTPPPFARPRADLAARPLADFYQVLGGTGSRPVIGDTWSVLWSGLTGPRVIRAASLPEGWWLKSVMRGDRDVTDTPIVLNHGDAVKDLTIVLDDKPTSISGAVTDAAGRTIGDCTVIAFADDASVWGVESRFVRAVRPDHQNAFTIAGLPPGVYRVAAVDYVEQGQWLDPKYLESLRDAATRLTLEPGQKVTLELRLVAPTK
jgi:uncharacterized protein (DUF2141 family)